MLDQVREKFDLDVRYKILPADHLKEMLLNEQYSVIFSGQPIDDKKIANSYLGTEHLIANLNEFTPLANQTSVSFSDLHGMSFIVLQDIGIWREIIQQKIPDAKFLYQNKRSDFDEIKNYSIFPYFTTNISLLDPIWNAETQVDRRPVPISDKEASMKFYANYLTANKDRVMPLIQEIQDVWSKVD